MNENWRWSPPQYSEEGLSEGLSVARVTAWRRRVGFVEDGGLTGTGCALDLLDLLGRWLMSAGPALTLRLVFKVGGPHRSVAWLGLAADGGTPVGARRRLLEPASDLAEALDAWGLFETLPAGGPRYPRAGRRIVVGPALSPAEVGEGGCERGTALHGALLALSRRSASVSVCVDLRGGNRDPAIFSELDRLEALARCQADRACSEIASWLDGSAQKAIRVVHKVEGVAAAALVGEVDFRLHGLPPGALLREQLLESLGWDLTAQLTLAERAQQPVLRGTVAPIGIPLQWLSVGLTARPSRRRKPEARPSGSERVLY